jgi:hypothetical protein
LSVKKGEEGYEEYLKAFNERRRLRRSNPVYREMESARWARQTARRKADADPDNRELAKDAEKAAYEAVAAKEALDSSRRKKAEEDEGDDD